MRSFFHFKNLVRILVLLVIWCILWREISVANVASGLVVGAIASHFGTTAVGGERINILILLRLIELILVDLLWSTISVVGSVIKGTNQNDEAIIEVKLPVSTRPHLFLIVTAITLTPGTAVVDINQSRSTIHVHLLDKNTGLGVSEHIAKLSDVVCRALPVPLDPLEGASS